MQNTLSPIAERSEDLSPPFGGPVHLLGGQQSLSLMSSYEQDGIKYASRTGPNSLLVEDDEPKFAEQKVMHKFRSVSLDTTFKSSLRSREC